MMKKGRGNHLNLATIWKSHSTSGIYFFSLTFSRKTVPICEVCRFKRFKSWSHWNIYSLDFGPFKRMVWVLIIVYLPLFPNSLLFLGNISPKPIPLSTTNWTQLRLCCLIKNFKAIIVKVLSVPWKFHVLFSVSYIFCVLFFFILNK